MGSPEQFDDFKRRLEAAGLGYSNFEYVQGPDAARHLALLSRYPIVERQSLPEVGYVLNGRPEKVRRGFLDVTLRVGAAYRIRLLGAHLKSKLPVPEGEALIRRHEARLLRKHVDDILQADPACNLLCYGDFNALKNEPALQELQGPRGSPSYLADLWAKDRWGDRWTHYWRAADLYSRIDYLLVAPGLLPEVLREKSEVYRSVDWDQASDHRPVFTRILPRDRP
jgi:endonuclease/exonuclease/phosphatase family metal-dependent hydrolase